MEKRGPKFKKLRVTPDLKKIEKLNELLKRREVRIRKLEGLLERYQKGEKEKEPRPKRFFDILRSREQKEMIVQQFICAHCGEPVHLEEESAFFWVGK